MNQNYQQQREEIAIIGMACRFPGANDCEQFWHNLETGVNSVTEIPPQKWEVEKYYSPQPRQANKTISKWSGLIEASDKFDAQFFAISPREAKFLDPQQKLMLEISWCCLEDAGYSQAKLSGTNVGVFIGACNYDSILNLNQDQENIEGYVATGTWTCMIANRISYFLNLRGLSVPVDTACSSSLVALHLGMNALQNKECDLVLVGGISILNTPTMYVQMSQLGMLSPTGQCHTFDKDADGYVRGEGVGMLLLKPLKKAMEDRDHIYGILKGSAINHGGKAQTLSSPNVYAQAQVLRAAYTKANIAPNTVSYIEVHGTGTPLGDPIEINALKRSFRHLYQQYNLPATEKYYCGLGTVKTNIGHLEGAAGVAGIIKVLLSMKHKKLPKNLNFNELNPHINLDNSPFYIVTETQPWQQLKTETEVVPRRAGVSSFGIGGVNVHVVLEEAPETTTQIPEFERPWHILTLSAKHEKALQELVQKYQSYLQSNQQNSLADICFTANTGRNHFQQRCFVIAESEFDLRQQLESCLKLKRINNRIKEKGETPKIAFVFTGEGSQYVNMGWQLFQTQPTFRQALKQCAEILQPYLDKPLLDVLYPQSTALGENSSLLEQYIYIQPALFAVEYALAQLWQSWGIKPDVVIGHGVGEYVAACVAGIFTLEEGLKLVATRGKLMQHLSNPEIASSLDSPLIASTLADFRTVAQEITYNQPKIHLIFHPSGQQTTPKIPTPEYWLNHLQPLAPCDESIQILHQQGYQLFLEIGPQPILLETISQYSPNQSSVCLSSLSLHQPDWQQMLSSLGKLYEQGINVDWSGFDRDYPRCKVSLPTYPFQRQLYCLETSEKEPQKDNLEYRVSPIDQLFSQEETDILQQLEKTPQKDRLPLMINYLQGVASELLGLNDSKILDIQLGFFDLGMNYSMTLEFSNLLQIRLGYALSITTFSEHFNIQRLAQYLIENIFGEKLDEDFQIARQNDNKHPPIFCEDEIEFISEDVIANAIGEEASATAITKELQEIQLILNL